MYFHQAYQFQEKFHIKMDTCESSLQTLVEMGYDREEALEALQETNGNLEAAIELMAESSEEELEERYKLVYLVRTDLNMGTGKIAAQVGHATLGAYKQCPKPILDKWEQSGQAKIVLQVDSLDQLLTLEVCAKCIGLLTHHVQDAGHTQVDPGTITVSAIGPDMESKINQVTGSLKLFR